MADGTKRDSEEFDGDIVTPEEGLSDGVAMTGEGLSEGGVVAEGTDQPGENLASVLLPDDVPAYQVSDTEAEELDESTPAAVSDPDGNGIDDEAQLAEAEAVAAAATSTRPMKRKQKRAPAEAGLVENTAEPVGNAGVGTVTTLRPQKKSAEVVAKNHATPKRSSHGEVKKKKVGPVGFVRESIEELRKVVWPTGAQLWQYFVVVLVFVLFIIAFVSLLDFAFGWALLKLLG